MDQNWSKLLMSELKRIIKEKGFNYREIASLLKMSESGFKKLINSADCSLKKIEKICQIIDIRMADLFESAERLQLKEVHYTHQQEQFFSSQRIGFLLYWMLVYERRNLTDIQILLNLDKRKTWTLLRKMDALDLIKILPADRLGLPQPQGIKWVGRTKFIADLYQKWGLDLLLEGIENQDEKSINKYFTIRYLQMSDSTWSEFKLNLERLEIKFTNTATQEMRMNIKNLKHVRWISIADQKSWAENELKSVLVSAD